MNILYVGNEIKGSFVNEISRKDTVSYTGSYNRVAEYEDVIFANSYDVILFDVDNLIDESLIIKEYITRVWKVKKSKIIIVASGYSYRSELIMILLAEGLKNYIFGTNLATQYEEYEKCLSGYFEKNIDELVNAEIEEEKINAAAVNTQVKSIGIAGVMSRIGTTTVCLQLAKYIQHKGNRVAYVEINDGEYIDSCERLYADVVKSKDSSYITYNKINLYPASRMDEVLKGQYDYIICDYGDINSPSFNKVSLMEKDLKIFVAGSKPNEFEAIQSVLQSTAYSSAKFVFNFVPEADKSDLKEMMCEKAEDTIFTIYTPDPFDYIHNSEFEKILPIEDQAIESEKAKEKRFLFRLRKDK